MSKRNDLLLLEDIIDAISKIERYIKNLSYDDFLNDDKTNDAVIRNFEIIGEAANNLSDEICLKYPKINWRQVIGFRNRLVHEYFGIDYQIIWKIINENLASLNEQILNIIKEQSK